jgi:hypothetical protein
MILENKPGSPTNIMLCRAVSHTSILFKIRVMKLYTRSKRSGALSGKNP